MTSKRFLHKRTRARFTAEKSAQMNKARWDADRARRDSEEPERIRELADIKATNLPRKQGNAPNVMLDRKSKFDKNGQQWELGSQYWPNESHTMNMKTAPRNVPELSASDKEKFWRRVDVSDPLKCWPWKGHINKKGYGLVTIQKERFRAHRVSLALKDGALSAEKPHALHSCDNPKCCNPFHLFAGTHTDNMRDMMGKGRGGQLTGNLHSSRTRIECRPRGNSHRFSKFTEDQVLDIRRRIALKTHTRKHLAAEYGVSVSTITAIHLRQNWFHI